MTYTVHIERDATLTRDTIEVVIEMAGFGMTYWAVSADWTPSAERYAVTWHEDDDPDRARTATTTYSAIADAMARIYGGSVESVSRNTLAVVRAELDDPESGGAEVDADAGDDILQVALFGEVVFG